MDQPKPIAPLTGLRFVAAMVVVFHHTAAIFVPQAAWYPFVVRDGYVGVSLFFVLSGFILTQVYLVQRESPTGLMPFYRARFARIYPVFAASLLLHAPFVAAHFAAGNPALPAAGKSVATLGANLLMVHAWAPAVGGGWNPPGWSLSTETFFYLLFPLLVPPLFRWPLSRLAIVVLAVHALSLVAPWMVLRARLGPEFDALARGPLQIWLERFPPLHLHEFLIGVLACRLGVMLTGARGDGPSWRSVAAGPLALVAILVGLRAAEELPGSRILINNGLLALLFGALMVALASGRGPLERLLGSRIAVVLGGASYAIYLLHIPLLFWFCHVAGVTSTWAEPPRAFAQDAWPAYALYLAVVIAISCICFIWFEDPARRWLRGRTAPATA